VARARAREEERRKRPFGADGRDDGRDDGRVKGRGTGPPLLSGSNEKGHYYRYGRRRLAPSRC
jgi:hypothetical protein